MMTKKDYVLTAKAIAGCMRPDTFVCITDVACRLADAYSRENPKFDRDRFLAACGVKL